MPAQPVRDRPFVDAARLRQRAHDELLRYTDAKSTGNELVPEKPLGAGKLAPRLHNHLSLLFLRLLRERKHATLDQLVQRYISRLARIRQQQRHRLGEVTD